MEPSGFLGDFSQLWPGPYGDPALLYRNPDANFRKYDKFMIDTETNTQLGAMVDRRAGGKSLEGSLHSWEDVEQAIQFWAERFGYRICLARGGQYCVQPEKPDLIRELFNH